MQYLQFPFKIEDHLRFWLFFIAKLGIFVCSFVIDDIFQNQLFRKILSGIPKFWVANSLDQDQTWHIVRPDLGPNCLQMLSEDDKSQTHSLILAFAIDFPQNEELPPCFSSRLSWENSFGLSHHRSMKFGPYITPVASKPKAHNLIRYW